MAVQGGRGIANVINNLLSLPFQLKIATRDCHPRDHISFDISHAPPDNKAFESHVKIQNPENETQTMEIPLWPVHCVKGTKGAEIIPEIETSKLDDIVDKGKDQGVEMFSAFADVFGNKSSTAASFDLQKRLSDAQITHVYAVGLAGDYCVKCTALDAKSNSFDVYVVGEATKSVDSGESGWIRAKDDMSNAGIKIIHMEGPEIERVKALR